MIDEKQLLSEIARTDPEIYGRVQNIISRMPGKRGRWVDRQIYLPECSVCGGKAYGLHAFDAVRSAYCPHCGAKMGEVEE